MLEKEEAEFSQAAHVIPFFDHNLEEEDFDKYMQDQENVDNPTSEGDISLDLDIDDIIF